MYRNKFPNVTNCSSLDDNQSFAPGRFRKDRMTRYDRLLNFDTCPGAWLRSCTSRGGRGRM